MKYRSEVDGLRCLAVMPVVLFHAGVPFFPGGFAGVDVFFVISGFLITTILMTEMREERFSIWRFYERRARRILPALCVVVLACLPLGAMWMSPEQFRDLGQSILAVGLFVSNVLFWLESNYFTAAAEEKPLLHTWSLAVEEQYYILFPLILLMLWRFWPRRVLAGIVLMTLVSFVWCLISVGQSPERAFYLLPSRAWELLTGSLCAIIMLRYSPAPHQGLSLLGLVAVVASMFVLNDHLPFPSAYTVLPVAGTALILIYARGDMLAARILSWRPLVFIGLISYSLYLWHQPLMAFARIRSITPPGIELMSMMALVSILLAWLSWRYVEQPFRPAGSVFRSRGTLLGAGALSLVVCVGLGLVMQSKALDAPRLGPEAMAVLEQTPPGGPNNRCYNQPDLAGIRAGDLCRLGDSDVEVGFLILGDSHASALTEVLSDQLTAEGRAALTVNGGWCAPLTQFGTATTRKNPACRARVQAALEQVADLGVPVVLYAEWANYTTGGRWGDAGPSPFSFADEHNQSLDDNPRQFALALQATLDLLQEAGVPVVFVSSTPEYEFDVPSKVLLAVRLGLERDRLRLPMEAYQQRNAEVEAVYQALRWPDNVTRLDAGEVFCDLEGCLPMDEAGRPLFADSNHLNRLGAARLGTAILERLGEI